jgi:polyphenol oxidase
MRDLASSNPNDPRGFTHQANVHCWNCSVSINVHGSWQFFAWHRAYLYFHERILGSLINDPEFRLPYWDWETPSHRQLPSAYTNPNDAANPLWNGTRSMSPTDEVPDEDVGEDVMEAAMAPDSFAEFGGTATNSGIPEGAPHGSVHVDVGGDMGAFATAGRDPVFYAHHSNIDKMWSDWNKVDSIHTNPTDQAFLDLTFTFFDSNSVWTSIKASQMLDHEARLRYTYGPSRFAETWPCILRWIPVRTTWQLSRALDLQPAVRQNLTRAVSERARVRMHLDGVQLPLQRSAVYRIYMTKEDAQEDKGPDSPGYLGSVPIVLNDQQNRHPVRRPPRVAFSITRRVPRLLERQGRLALHAVERGAGGTAPTPLPVRAVDVYFSIGETEK